MPGAKIGLKETVSLGIGGMVGGGIFAVLGLAVSLAKGGTPISFLFAGLIALITSYSYVKLSIKYPDRGGTVKFINSGFGTGVFSGGVNNLLWVSYIIMLSLYASAFGSYAPNIYEATSDHDFNIHLYSTVIVVFATLVNYYSLEIVGRIEKWAVIIKLFILVAFVLIGAFGLMGNANLDQLSIENWETPVKLLAGGMVIFVAYEGFELIANATPDIENPKVNIPKAYFYSVGFVIVLYIVIALITVGSLPFNEIADAQDYVLAEAAKPMLGDMGFTIITIAAIISTFSAINASLYGGSQVSFEIARDGELPHQLTGTLWGKPEGLFVTSILTLVVANTLNLESISTTGSIGFLFIFAMVNFTGFKLSDVINGNKVIPFLGFILCLMALAVLIVQQFNSNPESIYIAMGIGITCFLGEFVYKKLLV